MNELLGEQNSAGPHDGNGRSPNMLAEEPPELPFAHAKAVSQIIDASVVQSPQFNQRQGP